MQPVSKIQLAARALLRLLGTLRVTPALRRVSETPAAVERMRVDVRFQGQGFGGPSSGGLRSEPANLATALCGWIRRSGRLLRSTSIAPAGTLRWDAGTWGLWSSSCSSASSCSSLSQSSSVSYEMTAPVPSATPQANAGLPTCRSACQMWPNRAAQSLGMLETCRPIPS